MIVLVQIGTKLALYKEIKYYKQQSLYQRRKGVLGWKGQTDYERETEQQHTRKLQTYFL